MIQRRATQFPQRVLQAVAETLEALGITQRHVISVRIRQHEVAEQMRETLPADGDVLLAHAREVALPDPPRHVLLSEEDFTFSGSGGSAPVLQPPLQRPQLAVGELARMLPLQGFKQCPGFQPRIRRDLVAKSFPYFGDGSDRVRQLRSSFRSLGRRGSPR